MREAKTDALTAIIIVAEDKSVRLVPVDTGRLRADISHFVEPDGRFALLGTNVDYAVYVELGTFKQVAQPFIRPGLEGHEQEYQRIAQQFMNEVINRG